MINPICQNCNNLNKNKFVICKSVKTDIHEEGEYQFILCLECRVVKDLDDEDDDSIIDDIPDTDGDPDQDMPK